MKRPPARVTVDGETVRIKVVGQKRMGRLNQGYGVAGDYTHDTRVVRVGDGLTDQLARITVLHELMHHCLRRAGSLLPIKDEEYVLSLLDTWMVQMFDENPELADYVFPR